MSLVQTPLTKKNRWASHGVGAGVVGTRKLIGLGVGRGVGSQRAGGCTGTTGSEHGQETGTRPVTPLDPLEPPLDPFDMAGAKHVHDPPVT